MKNEEEEQKEWNPFEKDDQASRACQALQDTQAAQDEQAAQVSRAPQDNTITFLPTFTFQGALVRTPMLADVSIANLRYKTTCLLNPIIS